jgi:hypothetical protein
MKKLLFGLVATALFTFSGNAQEKLTNEELRAVLAQGMVDFTNSVKPAYEKTTNLEDFKKTVTGCWYSKMPKEGGNLLNAAYTLLSRNLSDEEIIKSFNGKELAEAALYVNELKLKNPKSDGVEIFGGTTGDFNPYAIMVVAKCSWYQLGCILKEIFGENGGETILAEIVHQLANLIKNL